MAAETTGNEMAVDPFVDAGNTTNTPCIDAVGYAEMNMDLLDNTIAVWVLTRIEGCSTALEHGRFGGVDKRLLEIFDLLWEEINHSRNEAQTASLTMSQCEN